MCKSRSVGETTNAKTDTVEQGDRFATIQCIAATALTQYALDGERLTAIGGFENDNFMLESGASRYVVRVHRHDYQVRETIQSELIWLRTLCERTRLHVPRPVQTIDGSLVVTIYDASTNAPYNVTVLGWVDGSHVDLDEISERHMYSTGQLVGELHNCAEGWIPPCGFLRREWDRVGQFSRVLSRIPGNDVDKLDSEAADSLMLPQALRDVIIFMVDAVSKAMSELGRGSQHYGMIHADLHIGNLVFRSPESPGAIDFDDCGMGYFLYDLATVVWSVHESQIHEKLRESLLEGYRTARSLSRESERLLNTFVGAKMARGCLRIAARWSRRGSLTERDRARLATTARSLFEVAQSLRL